MQWRLDNEWLITDKFAQQWRFWIVPAAKRGDAQLRIAHRALPRDPVFHLVYYAFTESRVADLETATSLAEIYDVLAGAHLSQQLARSIRDPRQHLRGMAQEIRRALHQAIQLGLLEFERHEVPWPFPDQDEKPPSKRDPGPPKEEDPIVEYPFSM